MKSTSKPKRHGKPKTKPQTNTKTPEGFAVETRNKLETIYDNHGFPEAQKLLFSMLSLQLPGYGAYGAFKAVRINGLWYVALDTNSPLHAQCENQFNSLK